MGTRGKKGNSLRSKKTTGEQRLNSFESGTNKSTLRISPLSVRLIKKSASAERMEEDPPTAGMIKKVERRE